MVVLAVEVGGQWSEEAVTFMCHIAKPSACTVFLRPATRAAFFHQWTGMLAVAAQRALAATLLAFPVDDAEGADSNQLELKDVLVAARLVKAPLPSRVV